MSGDYAGELLCCCPGQYVRCNHGRGLASCSQPADLPRTRFLCKDCENHRISAAQGAASVEDDDVSDAIEWCRTPDCVRPVSHHPGGMHLAVDGREFGDPRPTLRAVT